MVVGSRLADGRSQLNFAHLHTFRTEPISSCVDVFGDAIGVAIAPEARVMRGARGSFNTLGHLSMAQPWPGEIYTGPGGDFW